jgi:hypothetical protein
MLTIYILVNAVVSKYPCFIRKDGNLVFSNKTTVFLISDYKECVLHSTMYISWIYKYSTTLRSASTINFSIDECFNNFPFPQNLIKKQEQSLEYNGEKYYESRESVMLSTQRGLTDIYNLFHSRSFEVLTVATETLDDKAFEKKYGKDPKDLRKHLAKTEGTCTYNEAVQGILKLRELHVEMDNAVLEAYGWQDIALKHDFYEVDYLPENDRGALYHPPRCPQRSPKTPAGAKS